LTDSAPIVLALSEIARSGEHWEAFHPGIEARRIYGSPGQGPAAALLRYAPGASLPGHAHTGYEHIYVVSGEQCDERGVYPQGTLVVNPPGTSHSVSSLHGCVVLVVWERPVRF
jgi:anti-sigma factor ChrR (cupin superfamily)